MPFEQQDRERLDRLRALAIRVVLALPSDARTREQSRIAAIMEAVEAANEDIAGVTTPKGLSDFAARRLKALVAAEERPQQRKPIEGGKERVIRKGEFPGQHLGGGRESSS